MRIPSGLEDYRSSATKGRIYGSNILFVTSEIFLAIRGRPYMTPYTCYIPYADIWKIGVNFSLLITKVKKCNNLPTITEPNNQIADGTGMEVTVGVATKPPITAPLLLVKKPEICPLSLIP